MRHSCSALILSLCIALAGCAKEEAPASAADSMAKDTSQSESKAADPRAAVAQPAAAPKPMGVLSDEDKARLQDTVASSFGKGSFEDKDGNTYRFTMEGSVLSDKSGYGRFRVYSFQDAGKMDVSGDMSCVHIDSAERRIWLAGVITENKSTGDSFSAGQYAPGGHLQFRARPNSMDGKTPAAIEVPAFVDRATAEAFCGKGDWSDDVLYDLGENDLIAAIP